MFFFVNYLKCDYPKSYYLNYSDLFNQYFFSLFLVLILDPLTSGIKNGKSLNYSKTWLILPMHHHNLELVF